MMYFNVPMQYSMPSWSGDATRMPWSHLPAVSDPWNHKESYSSYPSADARRAPSHSAVQMAGNHWEPDEEPGAICVVNSLTSGACASLCTEAETADIVGFDAEWVPDWTWASDNPISVLQLAFPESGRVYVIQLGALRRQLPQAVQLMLLNPEVTKVGFACNYKDEAKMASSGIVVARGSMVDVQSRCAALLGLSRADGRFVGLKRAAQELLGFMLEKDKRHTCSDWSQEKLTPEQVRYAALDAWVALRLYYRTR
mmetsp:Transcript_58039/g.168404  ORF Transcript_58039/g.168404 Transcript_58039/m.168404 type:complete len:255 (-) Transcript_58039:145-909(-)